MNNSTTTPRVCLIPTAQDLLNDYASFTNGGTTDIEYQTRRLIRLWFLCGHDLALLPAQLPGITAETIQYALAGQ